MRSIKLFLALFFAAAASFAQAQFVQPMGYNDYSFYDQVNIGNKGAKKTHLSAYLELGRSNGSTRGVLLPRGQKEDVLSPAQGLIFYDLPSNRLVIFDGQVWKDIGSGVDTNLIIRNQYSGKQLARAWLDSIRAERLITEEWRSPYNFRLIAGGRPFGFIGYTNDPASQGASVFLGQYAGNDLFGNNWTGDVGIGNEVLRKDQAGANTGIGNWVLKNNTTGYRNTSGGHSASWGMTTGSYNANWGAFTLELQTTGSMNSMVGYSAGRSNKLGNELSGLGNGVLMHNTTEVASISLANTGTGYTTPPTVIISAPEPGSPGGISIQATATATINGIGQVTDITVTNKGAGYGGVPTVTLVGGGGSGAAGVAVIKSGRFNTAGGSSSLTHNRTGSYLSAWGYLSGYGAGGNEASMWDESMTFLGAFTSRHSSVATTTSLSKSTAIGYNAKVSVSNALVLGGTGADAVKVGIGTHAPAAELHTVGNIRMDWKTSIPTLSMNAGWNLSTTSGQHVPMGEIIFMPHAGQSWSNGASIRGVLNHFSGGIDELNGLVFYTSARTGYAGQSNFGDRDQMFLNGYGALILAQGNTATAWDGQSALLVRSKFANPTFRVQSWQNYSGTEIGYLTASGLFKSVSLQLAGMADAEKGTRQVLVDSAGNFVVGPSASGSSSNSARKVVYERSFTNKDTLNVNFSGLSLVYKDFEVHFELDPSQDEALMLSLSSDGATFPYTGHAYAIKNDYQSLAGLESGNIMAHDVGGEPGEYIKGFIKVNDPGNSNLKPRAEFRLSCNEKNTGWGVSWWGTISKATAAPITDLQLKMVTGSFTSGRVWIEVK